jgi:hypothetical protein
MKRIVFIVLILSQSYILSRAEKALPPGQGEATNRLKAESNFHHYILYSANFPFGTLGLKYAVSYKRIGIYASGNYSAEYKQFTYATGGVFVGIGEHLRIYAGGGAGPFWYWDSQHTYKTVKGIFDRTAEAGIMVRLGNATLDARIGTSDIDAKIGHGTYLGFGAGVNF